jgi:hypothetical protein
MSMTNTIDENSDKGVPMSSTVMFPGQSHISIGITVLMCGVRINKTVDKTAYALESVFRYSYRGFQVECLLWMQLIEEHIKYGCLPCSVGHIKTSNWEQHC